MSTKTVEHAFVKALATAVGAHEIEFYAIAFSDAPDRQGDIIHPNAADAWLESFYAKGKPLPVSYRHAAFLGESRGDPFSVIGWAPADPMHVWKDEHGVRVRAFLETEINDKAEQVYRLAKSGVLTGASAVFAVMPEGEMPHPEIAGATLITSIHEMKEAGLCLDPANDGAYLLSVKAEAVERSKAWDGAAAMRSCSSAADYRSICAGEKTIGEPDQAQHWALPHHNTPGAPANPDGVAAARGRLSQTQNLKSKEAARTHLYETHTLPSDSERAASLDDDAVELVMKASQIVVKAGRSISSKNEKLIRHAMQMLTEALASLGSEQAEEVEAKANAEEPVRANAEEPNAWIHTALASFEEVSTPA
jgi:phage head maturation protease